MAFRDFFINEFETSDNAHSPELQTHYYRNDYNRVKAEILQYANHNRFEVISVNDEVKEIFLQKDKQDVMMTLVAVTPYEIAIDIRVATYYLIGMRRGLNIIKDIYQSLNKALTLKGVSLYR
jgi:hypothetical protein